MSGVGSIENVNPQVYAKASERDITTTELDEDIVDEIDDREVFDMLRGINDPEHPLSLEELNVVDEAHVFVDNNNNQVLVEFTPTIPHCSMATLIGLCLCVRLLRSLPPRFKWEVKVAKGTHASEEAINKQLADKERVAAALENNNLIEVVNQCLVTA